MMESNEQHLPWNNGLPTKPDVDALLSAYRPESIKPGAWRIKDEQVRELIGKSDGNRFRTVTMSWRKRLLRDHAVLVYREKESGFFCPAPEEVFANTHPTLEQAGRKIGKQLKGVSVVKPENEVQKITQEHQGKLLYVTKRELKKARLNVLPSTAVPDSPRIQSPQNMGN